MGCAFWKIVKSNNLPPKPLAIPRGSALRYFANTPCMIVVVDPNEMEWLLKVEKRGQRLFINEGWGNFCNILKIVPYNCLYFDCIGKRRFSVRIVGNYSIICRMKKYYVEFDDEVSNVVSNISARKQEVVSFVVANFPGLFKFGKIRMPKKFNDQYGLFVPREIVLFLDNGDDWACVYDHESNEINALEKFMEFYGVDTYWFMVISYFGEGLFSTNLFSPKCFEIFYPKLLHSGLNFKENCPVEFQVCETESIAEEKSGALLLFNVGSPVFKFFRFVIRSVHMRHLSDKVPICEEMYDVFKNWRNGDVISLRLLKLNWKIEIQWCNYYCMFGNGWKKFVEDVCIRLGDTCIFECTSDPLEFNVCILRHEDYDFSMVNPGDILEK